MIKIPKLPLFYAFFITLGITFLPVYVIYAQSSSTNYRIEETFFGTGGEVDATSTNYRSQQSAGSLGVGNTSSANFDAVAGNITPNEPFLEMAITGPNIDLGDLSPGATSFASSQGGACNCTFYVRTYLSSTYSVVTVSNPPTNESGFSFLGKPAQGAPSGSTSVEEFGINLVANTSLGTFGANPVNVRQEGASEVQDNSFADGQAATGYQTADQFKYVAGDIIARSQATAGNQAVGKTNYTISYIMKPSNTSRAGTYIMRHDLVAVPTY
jgi:hypothetical protein